MACYNQEHPVDQRKLLGIHPHSYCRPLLTGLTGANRFDIQTDIPATLALRLRHRELHAALLTPIDYARDSSDYLIVPDVSVSSQLPNNAITIHFRKGIRTVSTLAVNPSSSSEIILATIILAEEFAITPTIIPAAGSLDSLLIRADAALLVGDDSLRVASGDLRTIDLVEAWYEMTDLPYVHGIWCGRESDLNAEDIRALQEGARAGKAASGEDAEAPLTAFEFTGTAESTEGLREFLRYAYFHGILPDVPDLHFYGDAQSDGADDENLFLN